MCLVWKGHSPSQATLGKLTFSKYPYKFDEPFTRETKSWLNKKADAPNWVTFL